MGKFQHSVTPELHYFRNMLLTTRRSVSCYGVSAWPNRAAREGSCEQGSAQTGKRAFPSDWKSA